MCYISALCTLELVIVVTNNINLYYLSINQYVACFLQINEMPGFLRLQLNLTHQTGVRGRKA